MAGILLCDVNACQANLFRLMDDAIDFMFRERQLEHDFVDGALSPEIFAETLGLCIMPKIMTVPFKVIFYKTNIFPRS